MNAWAKNAHAIPKRALAIKKPKGPYINDVPKAISAPPIPWLAFGACAENHDEGLLVCA